MTDTTETKPSPDSSPSADPKPTAQTDKAKELGGRKGPEPTRYGDWERNGIISDF